MMMQNVFYCVLYVLSGVVILRTLKRYEMNTLFYFALGIFLLLALYIPFYFGGNLMTAVVSRVFKSPGMDEMFIEITMKGLSAPFIYFKFITTGTFILALISIIIPMIAAVCLVVLIYDCIRKLHSGLRLWQSVKKEKHASLKKYIINNRDIYLRILRLRN